MATVLHPWQILVAVMAGWITRQQDAVIDYLREENPPGRRGPISAFCRSLEVNRRAYFRTREGADTRTFGGKAAYPRTRDQRIMSDRTGRPSRHPRGKKQELLLRRANQKGGDLSLLNSLSCFFVQGFHQCPGIPWRCVEFEVLWVNQLRFRCSRQRRIPARFGADAGLPAGVRTASSWFQHLIATGSRS